MHNSADLVFMFFSYLACYHQKASHTFKHYIAHIENQRETKLIYFQPKTTGQRALDCQAPEVAIRSIGSCQYRKVASCFAGSWKTS